jgi:hypothetical protein
VLYHLSHFPSFFDLIIFQIGSCVFCLGLALDGVLLPSWDYRCTQPRLVSWGLANFLPRLRSNHHSPDSCFLSSWDYSCELPCLVSTKSFELNYNTNPNNILFIICQCICNKILVLEACRGKEVC